VAANDRGWIPELRAMGASAEEIRGIREDDRKSQGISEAEENTAAEGVESAETLAGGRLVVVRLPHRRTAPAMDRLELAPGGPPGNVLVLSHEPGRPGLTEANFSGEGWLVAALAERFPGGWLGGALPERGFWGHAQPVPEGVVQGIVDAIKGRDRIEEQRMSSDLPNADPDPGLLLVTGHPETERGGATFSRFVLPFRYQLTKNGGASGSVYEEVPVECAVAGDRAFERLHYLTAETSEVLFGRARWFVLDGGSCQPTRELRIPAAGGGLISVRMRPPRLVLFECPPAAELRLSSNTDADVLRTGFVLVDLHFGGNGVRPTMQDLLRLNELFRYWRIPFQGHKDDYLQFLGKAKAELSADSKPINALDSEADPNRIYGERWSALLRHPVRLRGGGDSETWSLFPSAPDWNEAARKATTRPIARGDDAAAERKTSTDRGWIAHADHRAYVWTCAVLHDGLNDVRAAFPDRARGRDDRPAEEFGYWIKLLNVDRPSTASADDHHATSAFEREWAREKTYRRWVEDGTVYGFTQHSGAAIMKPGHYVRNFADMYFDQALLLLYLRVTTFRFSEELSRISSEARDARAGGARWRDAFDHLRRDFALFTNLYQFPLVSNQQQGIELYGYARRGLDVDELFREVQQEVVSTHEYFQIEEARTHTHIATTIGFVGGIGLALGLAMTSLSMNILQFNRIGQPDFADPELRVFVVTALGWFGGVAVCGGLVWRRVTGRWPRLNALRGPSRRKRT
jgi:hypothetical protein